MPCRSSRDRVAPMMRLTVRLPTSSCAGSRHRHHQVLFSLHLHSLGFSAGEAILCALGTGVWPYLETLHCIDGSLKMRTSLPGCARGGEG